MTLELIDEAVAAGARLDAAAAVLGLSGRTLIRWRGKEGGRDMRKGPNSAPANKLDDQDRLRYQKRFTFQSLPCQNGSGMLASRRALNRLIL